MLGFEQLRANQVPFHVIAVLTQDSLAYSEDIFHFFVAHNIRWVGFNIEEKEGIHVDSSLAGDRVLERYQEFMQTFYALSQQSGQSF